MHGTDGQLGYGPVTNLQESVMGIGGMKYVALGKEEQHLKVCRYISQEQEI